MYSKLRLFKKNNHKWTSAILMAIWIGMPFLFSNETILSSIDCFFLLEVKNPGFYYFFGKDNADYVTVNRDYIDLSSSNLLINQMKSDVYDGFSILADENGAIHYSGCNNGDDIFIQLSPSEMKFGDGLYSVTDSQNGIDVISSNEMYFVIEGWKITPLGVNKELIVNLSAGKNTFYVDNQFDNYCYGIVIKHGYTSEHTVFYPMIRKGEDLASYEPCLMKNQNIGESYSYTKIKLSKYLLDKISYKEFHYFINSINYQTLNNWYVIDFEDGTGIVFRNNSIVYGYLNNCGIIDKAIGDIIISGKQAVLDVFDSEHFHIKDTNTFVKGISSVPVTDNKLVDINNLITYLYTLYNEMQSSKDLTVLISIKDEGTKSINRFISDAIKLLGSNVELEGKLGCSYYAVFTKYEVQELIDYATLEYSGYFESKTPFQIKSGSYSQGNIASIVINGVEYAKNRRGLNIVVYNNQDDSVIDSVCFDTYEGLAAYRW